MLASILKRPMRVCIVDCATLSPAYQCFNNLVKAFSIPMEYHHPPADGIQSLLRDKPAEAYILFGSYSNVCDRLDWQKEVADFAREKLEYRIPVLGICFGHQLMADHFGGTVDLVNKESKLLEGTREFTVLKNQWGFKKGEKLSVFKYHGYEIKNLPNSFECLASSPECVYDLVRHKDLPYLGIQGHPEASWEFYESFTPPLKHQEIEQASRDGLSIIHRFLAEASKLLSV